MNNSESDSENDNYNYLKNNENFFKEFEKQINNLKNTKSDSFAENFFQAVKYLDENQVDLCYYTESMSEEYQKKFLQQYDKFLLSLNLTKQILNADWTFEDSQNFWDLYTSEESYLSNFFPINYENDQEIYLSSTDKFQERLAKLFYGICYVNKNEEQILKILLNTACPIIKNFNAESRYELIKKIENLEKQNPLESIYEKIIFYSLCDVIGYEFRLKKSSENYQLTSAEVRSSSDFMNYYSKKSNKKLSKFLSKILHPLVSIFHAIEGIKEEVTFNNLVINSLLKKDKIGFDFLTNLFDKEYKDSNDTLNVLFYKIAKLISYDSINHDIFKYLIDKQTKNLEEQYYNNQLDSLIRFKIDIFIMLIRKNIKINPDNEILKKIYILYILGTLDNPQDPIYQHCLMLQKIKCEELKVNPYLLHKNQNILLSDEKSANYALNLKIFHKNYTPLKIYIQKEDNFTEKIKTYINGKTDIKAQEFIIKQLDDNEYFLDNKSLEYIQYLLIKQKILQDQIPFFMVLNFCYNLDSCNTGKKQAISVFYQQMIDQEIINNDFLFQHKIEDYIPKRIQQLNENFFKLIDSNHNPLYALRKNFMQNLANNLGYILDTTFNPYNCPKLMKLLDEKFCTDPVHSAIYMQNLIAETIGQKVVFDHNIMLAEKYIQELSPNYILCNYMETYISGILNKTENFINYEVNQGQIWDENQFERIFFKHILESKNPYKEGLLKKHYLLNEKEVSEEEILNTIDDNIKAKIKKKITHEGIIRFLEKFEILNPLDKKLNHNF